MADTDMEALEALLGQVALQDDVVGVLLVDATGKPVAAAGAAETVDMSLADRDPDELEHFERDALGATAIAAGEPYGVRRQVLLGGAMRLGISFEPGADLDELTLIGKQAGLELMTLFKRVRQK